ncbi:MAG: amidase [Alphaproteobacteria bacterium]
MAPDTVTATREYDPKTVKLLSFHDAIAKFLDGSDTPRAYLERCIETIEAREPEVKAFVATNLDGARAASDASTARYADGKPLSLVDGMPVCIKDLYETIDMPTQMNSPVYAGWESNRDAAHVYALRRGGAAIVGKTVTTEFGTATPGPARNPHDITRTPGGSSSGTSAAIGAAMLPAGTGSQVRGSIQRPAGYCGNWAIKPTFGALNRAGGHSMAPSQSVLGVHAGSLEDCWRTAYFISSHAGGDAGQPGLYGEPVLGDAIKQMRLIRLDTRGWDDTESETKEIFEDFLARLAAEGVEIVSRRDDQRIEDVERSMETIPEYMLPIFAYEMRWPAGPYRDRGEDLLSDKIRERLERGEKLSQEDYRKALDMRSRGREIFSAIADVADACVTLSATGPAPVGMPVGDPVYGDISSCMGAPAFNLPLLADRGMPMGIQLLGQPNQDYTLARMGSWFGDNFLV